MKKIFFAITALLIISCSSDSSDNNSDNISLDTHLISKLTSQTIYQNDVTTETRNYTYNNNNLLTEVVIANENNDIKQTFLYNSFDLPIEIKVFNNNNLITIFNFNYNNEGNIEYLKADFPSLNIINELTVAYESATIVNIQSSKTINGANEEVSYRMIMNENFDVATLTTFDSNSTLIDTYNFSYDNNGNVAAMIVNNQNHLFEWDNKHNQFYNSDSIYYKRMPNGMSFNDFYDLLNGSDTPFAPINFLGNGINGYTKYFDFIVSYSYNSFDLAKTMNVITTNNNTPTTFNFNYEFIPKNN